MTTKDKSNNDEELRAFTVSTLGPILKVEDFSRSFGRKSTTQKLTPSNGGVFYLKRHEERRLYVTELAVYTEWIPKLRTDFEWHTPELVADSPELGALILTEVPGEIMQDAQVSLDDQLRMHRAAGQLASQIHQLDVDAHDVGAPRLYDQETWDRYLELAVPYLDSEIIGWLERISAGDHLFKGLSLVPTHSDFSPRNWLINRSGANISLGLIDWERARAGYWLEDVQRVAFDHWLKEPRLKTEFFDGYGRSPTAVEEHQLKLISLCNAVGTVSWATEHGDIEFADFGRRIIALLRSKLE